MTRAKSCFILLMTFQEAASVLRHHDGGPRRSRHRGAEVPQPVGQVRRSRHPRLQDGAGLAGRQSGNQARYY